MKDVHIVLGCIAIGLNAAAGVWGGWRYWQAEPSGWFWRLLRAGGGADPRPVLLGGVPPLGSFIAEQCGLASAQMILDSRGFETAAAVGRLPKDEQQLVVRSIVVRE